MGKSYMLHLFLSPLIFWFQAVKIEFSHVILADKVKFRKGEIMRDNASIGLQFPLEFAL
jgi:hypothetical protein